MIPIWTFIVVGLIALTYQPINHRTMLFGLKRQFNDTENIHGYAPKILTDLLQVEDMHLHSPSGLIFAAGEGDDWRQRWRWFPGTDYFYSGKDLGQGSLYTIDVKTDKVSKLKMVDFEGPFVTHGLDIYYSASSPNTVYIYAINHLPNPAWPGDLLDLPPALHPADPTPPKARSRVEIFKHEIGSGVATHLRSVWHAELRTPNDILAISEKEFYVTNDHYYREGFMRKMEDMNMPYTNKKTTTVFVTVDSLTVGDKKDDTTGVTAVVAIAGIHNNNGLGRGADDGEIIIGRAAAGVVTRLRKAVSHGHKLEVVDEIQLDSCIDNPFYFNDPYAKQTGRDASGYVLAGLGKAVKFPDPNEVDPVMIWLVRPTTPRTRSSGKIQAARRVGKELKKREGEEEGDGDGFVRRLIFQDNGKLIATASIGVLVAIDPEVNGGKKQAKLFLSGPFSKNAVVTIIDL